MLLLALFAATALALSAIGIYGVMAYFVTQRTHEIGIRMALGASPRDVIGMVLGQGVRLAAAGVVAGAGRRAARSRARSRRCCSASARAIRGRCVALSATLTAVALLACYIPARRATRVDPIRALQIRMSNRRPRSANTRRHAKDDNLLRASSCSSRLRGFRGQNSDACGSWRQRRSWSISHVLRSRPPP